jgi:hypothetical protein
MRIAGFDLATTSGAAILDRGEFVRADLFKATGEGDGELFRGFRKWFFHYLQSHQIERAAIEAPLVSNLTRKDAAGNEHPMASQRAYLRLYGFRAIALEVGARLLPEPILEVHQSAWRSAFLGANRPKGADLKALAVNQCALLRWPVPNRDAAEAVGVAWWLAGELRTAKLARPGDLFAPRAE